MEIFRYILFLLGSPVVAAGAFAVLKVVEPIEVPQQNLPAEGRGDELRHGVAVLADPQVLHYPQRCPRRRVQQPERHGQLLAVAPQARRLLLLRHPLMHHHRRLRRVPQLLRHLLHHPPQRRSLRVPPVAGEELVHGAAHLDGAAAGSLPRALLLHHLPHGARLLPPAGGGAEVGEDHVVAAVRVVVVEDPREDPLTQLDIAMAGAGAEQGPPEHRR
ncbi:unnamed protein product [Spirodela intermedia]|uniref:Uncharacterized protein n=1 Tax=Spirodela intermedia TaxID=51605 RepID=A0A7I8KVB0_SPIIN|nr:unnamed protein product [Spirodela intermedia]